MKSGDEEIDELLLEGGVELVRQPIRTLPLTARRFGYGGEDAVGGELWLAVGSLSLACRYCGEPLWRGSEEGGLGGGDGGTDSEERLVVESDGVSHRGPHSEVSIREGVELAIRRPD